VVSKKIKIINNPPRGRDKNMKKIIIITSLVISILINLLCWFTLLNINKKFKAEKAGIEIYYPENVYWECIKRDCASCPDRDEIIDKINNELREELN